MDRWPSTKARRVLAALIRQGWRIARQRGSHRLLSKPGFKSVSFAFHDSEEIGPDLLRELAKVTGLKPEDL